MKIHPFTFVYLLVAFYFRMSEYVGFLLFSLLHECGHYLAACYFDFDIEYMEILPFGAFLSLKDFGRHRVEEELVMLLAGPLVNFILMIIFSFCDKNDLVIINAFIGIFNLIPVYPLDGSKLIQLVFSYLTDYRNTFWLQIRISLIIIALGFVYIRSLGKLIVLIYLFYQNIVYLKNYRLFMLETILADHYEKKHIKLHHTLKYYRPYQNFYFVGQRFYDFEEMKINLMKSMKLH